MTNLKIAFWTPQLDVRGTCTSLYDYAHYNETLLKNSSVIIIPIDSNNDEIAVKKFGDRFTILYYTNLDDMDEKIKDCNMIYFIKYGKNDGIVSKTKKNLIHCVFDLTEPHGDIYAAVSETLAKKFNHKIYVPHMIGLQKSINNENLRKELNISEDAIVFGRHGGIDTFDIAFVKEEISKIVRERSDIYFIFVNTPRFDTHSNLFFLDKIIKDEDKNKFISSCDGMCHAQLLGETFGLSIAEFSVNNKPIITYGGQVLNDNYKKILKNNALYYYSSETFYNIITNFDKELYKNKDLNFYKEFSPEKVMKKFEDVFLM